MQSEVNACGCWLPCPPRPVRRLMTNSRWQAVSVTFARNWPRRTTVRAEVVEAAGLAWFAVAAGWFATVSVIQHDRRHQFRLDARPLW